MIQKKAVKPVPCLVARVVRAVCDVEQGELARELKIDSRVVSARERNTKGAVPSREDIAASVRAMDRPEELVELTFEYALRVADLFSSKSTTQNAPLRAAADRFGARMGRTLFDSVLAADKEVRVATERRFGDSCWLHFSKLPEKARREAARKDPLFHRWGFAERLWRESLNAAADDADRSLDLGEMAVLVAERMEEMEVPKDRLLGLAWSAVANARRVKGQLLEAERDLVRAKGLWMAGEAGGEAEVLDAARFCQMEAALRVDQRRFSEALACIEAAFQVAKPGEDLTYLLISKGNILLQLQRHGEAAALYLEATTNIGATTSPRDRFGAHFNMTACLIALGQAEDAERQLPALRRMAVALGNGLDLLRVRWLEAQVLAGLGHKDESIVTLGAVRDAFLGRGILWEASQIALERTALQLESGAFQEVKDEAPRLAEAFSSLGVARELLVSLDLFWSAARAELATAGQARQVLAQLRQAGAPRIVAH